MKKLIIVLMTTILLSAGSAWAAGQEVTILVKGMVCGFCAQGIEKKFTAEPAVEKVTISLKDKQVKLTFKEGQDMSDEAITKILKDSGYNVDKLERK